MGTGSDNNGIMYATVALNIPLEKTFEYEVPPQLRDKIAVGKLVRVPLGSRMVNGCVLELKKRKVFPHQVKPVEAVISPEYCIDPAMIELARWLAHYYFCPIGEALHCISFIGFNDVSAREEKHIQLSSSGAEPEQVKLTPKQQKVVDYLRDKNNEPTPPLIIENDLNITRAVIKALVRKNVLKEVTRPVERKDEYKTYLTRDTPLPLTPAQQRAYDTILASLKEGKPRVFLLFGVTGSGKTEVYLQVIAESLKEGRGAIVLVPEISLTPQTVERFRSRFGSIVGVYHSRMSIGQKYDLWQKIKNKQIKILVGARSAIFSPISPLGVIVIDEEQESTYKQDTSPRYHTREVAVHRARLEQAVLVLGSATPSIESYYRAQQGEYTLLRLPERVQKLPLPKIELLDLGKEIRSKRRHILISERLSQEIREALQRREQIILLLNRRGYANFEMCHSCREPVRCKKCDVTLTYHKTENKLICHYCGAKENLPEVCPNCGSKHIGLMGMGTQRIEEELERIFAGHRILRLDLDTTSSRFELLKKWQEIVSGKAEIILGTQMVAKGFDLARVTLVGVISADMSLFLPDFRSGERTFSLLTQAAGRAGRSTLGGKVIIQTFMPEYYAIKLATRQDYDAFAEKELAIRKAMRFPPFYHLASVLVSAKNQEYVRQEIEKLGNIFKSSTYQPAFREIDVIGPAPAVISRLRGKYRWRVLLRGNSPEELLALLRKALKEYRQLRPRRKVDLTVEIDPLDLM
ncbi:primosomal protein N' [Candidatus Sumerlaeota bacterium]|nr:primosomal protein N' [Candidatus Sumerlaeota bacterium]